MKTDATVTIHKAPEEVFPYLSDPEKVQQWSSTVKNLKRLTDGPLDVGSKSTMTLSILGQNIEGETEITAYDEPRVLAFKATSGSLHLDQRFTLSPTAEGTKLEAVAEGDPGGIFKLAQPLITPAAHKQLQDDLNRLKKVLEQ
jgi:carbon monoxide dehydrogenase subunit G